MTEGLITNGNWSVFLTLAGEELLLVRRKHLWVVVLPILSISIVTILALSLVFYFFLNLYYLPSFFAILSLMLISLALSIITKNVIDWYFHIYIVTNRRMLEICYTPLSSNVMSEVLLDKVNCTEVDLRVDGFFHELFDMGDVVITFDRPTRQEEFTIKDIKDCNQIGKFLTQKLIDHEPRYSGQQIWYKRRSSNLAGY